MAWVPHFSPNLREVGMPRSSGRLVRVRWGEWRGDRIQTEMIGDVARTGEDARRYIDKKNCTSLQIEASSYRYSTCERTAPSIPCTFGLVDSIT